MDACGVAGRRSRTPYTQPRERGQLYRQLCVSRGQLSPTMWFGHLHCADVVAFPELGFLPELSDFQVREGASFFLFLLREPSRRPERSPAPAFSSGPRTAVEPALPVVVGTSRMSVGLRMLHLQTCDNAPALHFPYCSDGSAGRYLLESSVQICPAVYFID